MHETKARGHVATVFIVGAGLSADYGFPLGRGLFTKLREFCCSQAEPFHTRVREACGGIEIKAMQRALDWTEADTVDEFLAENTDDMRRWVKTAMVDILLADERSFSLRSLRDHKDSAYHLLWNKFVEDSNVAAQTKIITFNYDRSLEFYLYRKATIKTVEIGRSPKLECSPIDILHVHGELGEASPDDPWWHESLPTLSVAATQSSARNIRVYSEPSGLDRFEKAWDWIERAERVVFLGFGFHDSNLMHLRFVGPKAFPRRSGRCHTTSYGLARERYEILKTQIDPNLAWKGPDVRCRDFLAQLSPLPP